MAGQTFQKTAAIGPISVNRNLEITMKTAIFYGSTYGNTQEVSEQLAQLLETQLDEKPELFDVHSVKATEALLDYDFLIIGCSTWNVGELQDDWNDHLENVEQLDWNGKTVALFGAGDQTGYADTFADGLGILGKAFAERGAKIVGAWPSEGYNYDLSLADLGDGNFIGLPLDYDNQDDLTEERLQAWATQLAREVGAVAVATG